MAGNQQIGGAATVAAGASYVIYSRDSRGDLLGRRITVCVAGKTATAWRVVLEFFDGTNWVTADAAVKAALTPAVDPPAGSTGNTDTPGTHPASYTDAVRKEWIVTDQCRVLVENTGSGTLTFSYNVREQIGY